MRNHHSSAGSAGFPERFFQLTDIEQIGWRSGRSPVKAFFLVAGFDESPQVPIVVAVIDDGIGEYHLRKLIAGAPATGYGAEDFCGLP